MPARQAGIKKLRLTAQMNKRKQKYAHRFLSLYVAGLILKEYSVSNIPVHRHLAIAVLHALTAKCFTGRMAHVQSEFFL